MESPGSTTAINNSTLSTSGILRCINVSWPFKGKEAWKFNRDTYWLLLEKDGHFCWLSSSMLLTISKNAVDQKYLFEENERYGKKPSAFYEIIEKAMQRDHMYVSLFFNSAYILPAVRRSEIPFSSQKWKIQTKIRIVDTCRRIQQAQKKTTNASLIWFKARVARGTQPPSSSTLARVTSSTGWQHPTTQHRWTASVLRPTLT